MDALFGIGVNEIRAADQTVQDQQVAAGFENKRFEVLRPRRQPVSDTCKLSREENFSVSLVDDAALCEFVPQPQVAKV